MGMHLNSQFETTDTVMFGGNNCKARKTNISTGVGAVDITPCADVCTKLFRGIIRRKD